jgi:pyridoxine/pyridoxamine 5'-phosphate oxidase
MTRDELLAFLRRHRIMVEASVTPDAKPQAAIVGYAVSDSLELVFDTLESTRKYQNLRANPHVALVIGWDDEMTAQLEGSVDFPTGAELERIKDCYFGAYPDGRERLAWPGITHVRVRPTWVRFTDYTKDPPLIAVFTASDLGAP